MEKRLEPILAMGLPYRETLTLRRCVYRGGAGPRMALTAGLHGDELEGLYLCHRLAAWLEDLAQTQPEALLGQIELYPALNPLGLDTLQRSVPVYDSDLDRSFPGHAEGLLPQRLAAAVMAQLRGADLVIDVHASNIYLRETPQARIDRRFADRLLPLAQRLNVDLIWLQEQAGQMVFQTRLAHSLNTRDEPCLRVEMGAGMRVTPAYTEQLLAGILRLWQSLGALSAELELPPARRRPWVVEDAAVHPLSADVSGLFVAEAARPGARVRAGDRLGRIVSPFEGRTLAEIPAPVDGVVFTLRHYPLVYEGSLLARVAALEPSDE